MRLLNHEDLWKSDKKTRLDIVYQSEASECGLACLAMLASYHGVSVDLPSLRAVFPPSRQGITLRGVTTIAEKIGLGARSLRLTVADLKELKLPAMLHWDMNHFVVLRSVKKTRRGWIFGILDPATGYQTVDEGQIASSFTGIALETWRDVSLTPPRATAPRLKTRQLWSKVEGLWSNIFLITALSIISQIVSLAMPFYLQVGIDSTVPSGDLHLLGLLGIGFLGLAGISLAAAWLRSVTIAGLNASFQFQVTNNLLRHVLSLPSSWFAKRHVGDIVSRFSSIVPIVDFINASLSTVIIDIFVVAATVILMVMYSPLLCTIAVIFWLLFVCARFGSIATVKNANVNYVSSNARESSLFIENVRGHLTIKAFAREDDRRAMWQNIKSKALRAQLTLARISAIFDGITGSIVSLELIVISFLSIFLTVKGQFTLGMVFAFQAYRQQFTEASTRLMDQYYKYRLLNVHLDRIGDIVHAPTERQGISGVAAPTFYGNISLRNVSFRYGNFDNPILKDVNLDISAGETVVFIGPSGGGKTTLVKLMMGLLQPSLGAVLVEGVDLNEIGGSKWRGCIGSVLQEDTLFAGTLAQNISFFEQNPNIDAITGACRAAAIYEFIDKHPLGLNATVGDMGSSLSGGQRQRIMLARALYTKPSALFMDEGTANLDPDSEKLVLETLKSLSITKILCAHRLPVIEIADRIFYVANGGVIEVDRTDFTDNRNKNLAVE